MFQSLPKLHGNYYMLARFSERHRCFALQAIDKLKPSLSETMRLFLVESDNEGQLEIRLTIKRPAPSIDVLTYIAASVNAFLKGAIAGKLVGGLQERLLLTTGYGFSEQGHHIVLQSKDGRTVTATVDAKAVGVSFEDIEQARGFFSSRPSADWHIVEPQEKFDP